MQQPSRWKRLYSKTPIERNDKLNEVSEVNLDEECNQVLDDLERILTQTSSETNDNVQNLLNEFPSNSSSYVESFTHEDLMLEKLNLIIEENEDEFELESSVGLSFNQFGETSDGAIIKADINRNKWILLSVFHKWCEITRDRRNAWRFICDRLCRILDLKLLHDILLIWKVHSHEMSLSLQTHYLKKNRNIFYSWRIYTRENCRRIAFWRDNRTKLRALKSWRRYTEFFVRLRSRSHSMRSNRLISSSFKYWRCLCETLSNDVRSDKRKHERDAKEMHENHKPESIIKCLNHRVQSQSRLKVKNVAAYDKENSINRKDRILDPRMKTRQRIMGQQNAKQFVDKRIDSRFQKHEEERNNFLRMKKEDKMKRERKQAELESRKKAYRLAKIHKHLHLLKMTLNAFKVELKNRRLKEFKADNVYHDTRILQCFEVLRKNVIWKRSERLEMSRRKFIMADRHYECRLCERALREWGKLVYRVHSVYFPLACERNLNYRKRDLVVVWIDALLRQRCHRISQISSARTQGDKIIRKYRLRQWKQRVDDLVANRIEEKKIKEKWDMVKKWLSEDESQ